MGFVSILGPKSVPGLVDYLKIVYFQCRGACGYYEFGGYFAVAWYCWVPKFVEHVRIAGLWIMWNWLALQC